VFIDPRTGAINGLSNGGSHDKEEQKPADTNQCHDITVYSAIGLAAGACSGNGILLDIKDPVNPKRVDAVNDLIFLLAFRFLLERWHQSGLHRRVGAADWARDAVRTTRTSGAQMRSSI